MGVMTRPLWLEAISDRKQKIEAKQNEALKWERGAYAKLREAAEACMFFGFYVEAIDPLTISLVPEPLHNEMVNVDASTIRVVKPPEGRVSYHLADTEHAFEVTYAPSIRRMVYAIDADPSADPPRDGDEKDTPEAPVLVTLALPNKNGLKLSVREELELMLKSIVNRLIDLKHPELVLKKGD